MNSICQSVVGKPETVLESAAAIRRLFSSILIVAKPIGSLAEQSKPTHSPPWMVLSPLWTRVRGAGPSPSQPSTATVPASGASGGAAGPGLAPGGRPAWPPAVSGTAVRARAAASARAIGRTRRRLRMGGSSRQCRLLRTVPAVGTVVAPVGVEIATRTRFGGPGDRPPEAADEPGLYSLSSSAMRASSTEM